MTAVVYFGPQGEINPDETHFQGAQEIFDQIELVYEQGAGRRISVLRNFPCHLLKPVEALVPGKISPQIPRVVELRHGLQWEKISARYGSLEHTGRDAFVTDNYDTVLKHIIARIDKDRFELFLNRPVKLVDTSSQKLSRVVCRD